MSIAGIRRKHLVYPLLVVLWLCVGAWQAVEHRSVGEAQRSALLLRLADISRTLAVAIRSNTRFGTLRRDRLEEILADLVELQGLDAVALVSPQGELLASAGGEFSEGFGALVPGKPHWDGAHLTSVEPVLFGPISSKDGTLSGVLLVEPGQRPRRRVSQGERALRLPVPNGPAGMRDRERNGSHPPSPSSSRESIRRGPPWSAVLPRRFPRRGTLHAARPPWMTKEEYAERYQRQGVQRFVLRISTAETHAALSHDRILRIGIILLALVVALSLAFSMRAYERASGLNVQLARTEEMNSHLRELSTAAAGLAHETRNPLNVVRGIAQTMVASDDASAMKGHAGQVIEEVDRVNSRLTEFISYARPCEPQMTPVSPARLARELAKALEFDREDKNIQFHLDCQSGEMLADMDLTRQILFNLIINAFEIVPEGGRVTVRAQAEHGEWTLRVEDNGSGVPEDQREEIFRPYVTLRENGTGLGLAVVRRNTQAQQWTLA
ncbi:MAG: hypothetical protein KAI66_14370, partial [Lentisphaeria bacterium]|nr:hypothetical protein [Lentisphaeria bacterium]